MAEKGQDRPKGAARPDIPESAEALEAIKDALRGLKFGDSVCSQLPAGIRIVPPALGIFFLP